MKPILYTDNMIQDYTGKAIGKMSHMQTFTSNVLKNTPTRKPW